MGRRAYGGGSNEADATLRQQLLAILHGGGGGGQLRGGAGGGPRQAGGKGAGRDGGGGRGGGGPAAGNQRSQRRPGDWSCPRCSYSNFAFRLACNSCGAYAPGGGAGQATRRPGDAGTASRQVPGGRPPRTATEARDAARRAGEPAFRVPRGASAASGARPGGDSAASTSQQRGNDAADSAGAAATTSGRGPQREAAVDAATSATATPAPASGAWATAVAAGGGGGAPRGRWADEDPPCDAAMWEGDDASDYADADAVDADLEEDEEEGSPWGGSPSSEDLRARWQQECRAVRALERVEKYDAEPSAALSAVRAARDRAEQVWRQSLQVKPVAPRMANAQRKADRAKRAVDKAAYDLEVFEEDMRNKRDELQEAVDSAKRRHDIRLRQLDDLHKEAGELAAANAGGGQWEQRGSGRAERLVDLLTSEMQAFVETLEEGSEARGRANLILAKVASADEEANAQRYVIHTDGEEVHDDEGFQTVGRRGRGAGGKGGTGAARREANWTTTANGRWCRHRASDDDGDCMQIDGNDGDANRTSGTASNKRPGSGNNGASEGSGARNAPAQGCAGDPGDGAARAGRGGRTTDAGCDEVRQPPNKSHRGHDQGELPHVETAGDDAARALRLRQEQEALVQATVAANASFGDNAAMQIAGQLYAQKVEALRERAKTAGVATVVGGREILQLTLEELNTWIDGVLKPAECKDDAASTEL